MGSPDHLDHREYEMEDYDESDLYDDILAPDSSEMRSYHYNSNTVSVVSSLPPAPIQTLQGQKPVQTAVKIESTPPKCHGPRYTCYVSGLTWWTTDADIEEVIKSVGVHDLIEVLIHINRTNGQSKGFAMVSCGSEESLKVLWEQLPQKMIYNQILFVHQYTRASLDRLDHQTVKKVSSATQDKVDKPPMFLGTVALKPQQPPRQVYGYGQPQSMYGGTPSAPYAQNAPLGVNPQYYSGPQDENSKAEIAKIIDRNRLVAETALRRADACANNGDVHGAVETLQMAANLVSQSNMLHETECRSMLLSLQNKLVEMQSRFRRSDRHSTDHHSSDRRSSEHRSDRRHGDRRSTRSRSRSPDRRSTRPRRHSRSRSRDRKRSRSPADRRRQRRHYD
ncbi:hypothetical protein L596_015370 [Steinernema carpocapsae]|uniref:RRM domain-containing protein n=1 Tax=Steinernema carpocapsae TaxID=34508 RepID=A0A4U5NFS4_STECR|nr:hypothetical protein L596_015370 [Steinernema carpocapsae]